MDFASPIAAKVSLIGLIVGLLAGYFRVANTKLSIDTASEINEKTKTSSMDEIKKLKKLLDSCANTQDEFDAKKEELLGL